MNATCTTCNMHSQISIIQPSWPSQLPTLHRLQASCASLQRGSDSAHSPAVLHCFAALLPLLLRSLVLRHDGV